MRYIGSKTATLPWLSSLVAKRAPNATSLCDPFAGTCTVARHFKRLGMRIVTGDVLRLSYVIQVATVGLNKLPSFERLRAAQTIPMNGDSGAATAVIDHLDHLPGTKDFVYREFSPAGSRRRLFFTSRNAARIDAVRKEIAKWRTTDLITDTEEAFLLASLIDAADRVANTAGTYYAHLKTLTRKARKPLRLAALPIVSSRKKSICHQMDARLLVAATKTDLLYLDPPYNERSYQAYYHLPETIARGDKPKSHGRSGAPTVSYTKSDFCRRAFATEALAEIVEKAHAKHIVVHYTPNGIVRHDDVLAMLKERGRVRIDDFNVRAYASRPLTTKPKSALHRVYWCEVG